jgi:hypothetical protein
MHDQVHGFDLHYEIDLERGVIVDAHSVVSRVPYRGICDEPQPKVAALVGQPVDALLRKRIQTQLGGESGCAQLYDLTADLLKLLTLRNPSPRRASSIPFAMAAGRRQTRGGPANGAAGRRLQAVRAVGAT